MRILRTIGRILSALALGVPVMVWEAGKWVLRARQGHQLPDTQDLMDDYVDAAETAHVTPEADRRLEHIQEIAYALSRGLEIPDQWLVGLSERTMTWIEALSPEMLTGVANAKPEGLQAHIAGVKSIRGLLAFDVDSIADYQRAVAIKPEPEPELERIRRRPRHQEPLLPAFGPVC